MTLKGGGGGGGRSGLSVTMTLTIGTLGLYDGLDKLYTIRTLICTVH